MAKSFHKMEVNNGKQTSFWYDNWSSLSCLKDLLNEGGSIALGIMENEMMEDVLLRHRKRRHRIQILNEAENKIEKVKRRASQEDDVPLWKQYDNKFSRQFSTKKTWMCIRQPNRKVAGVKVFGFPTLHLINGTFVLCQVEMETCQHLFFRCHYSSKIWREMVEGILKEDYTTSWDENLTIISQARRCPTETFIIRYTFQVVAHSIWRERNARKHGEQPLDEKCLAKMIDKMVRLKLLLVKGKGKKYLEEGLMKWFATRL
ncbi:uncharacterized protein LOC125594835 [Brassica napus]|uniref:uncharacterized protein LOC125594835 n=1 Tax=Brassica napus TaxID=3708 RepID=UPI002078844F|nr:uncharacterized protein LOC125594835 [Brassica napus]